MSESAAITPAQMMQQQHEAANAAAQVPLASVSTADPFPPMRLDDRTTASTSAAPASSSATPARAVDLSDESLFPSLSMGGGKKAGTLWGATPRRINAPVQPAAAVNGAAAGEALPRSNLFTERVLLPAAEIHVHAYAAGANGAARNRGSQREVEPTTLGEVMKHIMRKYAGVMVEASTSRNVTTFILKGKSEEDVQAAKRELLGRLAKKVTLDVLVPASLRGFIVGAKGAFKWLFLTDLILGGTKLNLDLPTCYP